jgi:hypothetical protein
MEVVASFYLVSWTVEASVIQQLASKYAQSVLGPFLEEYKVETVRSQAFHCR